MAPKIRKVYPDEIAYLADDHNDDVETGILFSSTADTRFFWYSDNYTIDEAYTEMCSLLPTGTSLHIFVMLERQTELDDFFERQGQEASKTYLDDPTTYCPIKH